MSARKSKGGKHQRGKLEMLKKRELNFKEDGEAYGQIIKILGNGRFEARCDDHVTRMCHVRGKLHKKVWINNEDIVLISKRSFEDKKADIILKYTPEEVRKLKSLGELNDLVDEDDIAIGEEVEFSNEEDIDDT